MFAIALALCLAPATIAEPAVYAIKNVRIETGTGEAEPSAVLVLRDGVIAAIGPGIAIPFDAEVLDGTGLTAVPGFIDAFNGSLAPAPAAAVEGAEGGPGRGARARGGASAGPVDEGAEWGMDRENRGGLEPHARAAERIALDESKLGAWREAGFTTALAVPAGAGLTGSSALLDLGQGPVPELLLDDAVFQHDRLSGGAGYPSTLMGVLAHQRQFFLDAKHNRDLWAWYERGGRSGRRPRLDAAYAAAAPLFERKTPVVLEADRADDIRTALAFAREQGFDVAIAGGLEAADVLPELAASGAFVILGLDFPQPPKGLRGKDKPSGRSAPTAGAVEPPAAPATADEPKDKPKDEQPAEGERERDREQSKEKDKDKDKEEEAAAPQRALREQDEIRNRRIGTAAALAKAGVPFCFTSRGVDSAADFRKNLALAIEQGLSRELALAALTFQSARLLGHAGVVGQLKPGRLANVVLFAGDPLVPESRARYVFVRGKKFEFDPPKPKKGDGKGAAPAAATNSDVAGTWQVEVELDGGTRSYTFEFTQREGQLSGSAQASSGAGEISGGRVDGSDVEFTVVYAFGDRRYEFTFRGEASGERMSGTVSINGGSAYPFSGKRATRPEYRCCEEEGR